MDSSLEVENIFFWMGETFILNLCAPTCSSSRLDLDFPEDFYNRSLTGASLSGTSKLAKFEIFQASNSLFFFIGRLSGSETFYYTFTPAWFTKWKWLYNMADRDRGLWLCGNFAMGSVLSLFRVPHTRLSMFIKTTVTKIVQPKVSEHILFQFVQHSYRE